jgi:glycosyltransferase involved in cell wall biosynthesis
MGMRQSRYELIDRVHYHRCPFDPHPDFVTYVQRMNDSFVWHFAETEAFHGRAFDVVHTHDWLAVPAMIRAKNDYGRPTVLTIHSTEYGRCGNSIWDDALSRRIRDLEWEGCYVARQVICVSQSLCREVQRLYTVPADKVHAIYNGIHVKRYDTAVDTAAVRRRCQIGLDDPLVLFAGRVTWQKGPDLLLEAVPPVLRSNPRAKFVFAGDGDMRARLEGRATLLGLGGATRFLGHRDGQELIGLFKSSDLVCVPSRNEPFGIVILEAWSARKAVVATRSGGPEEFVEDEHNGLKVDIHPEAIGRGVESLLNDTERARIMGRNGRREAETRFSWDVSAARTDEVYQSVLQNGRAATDNKKQAREALEEFHMAKGNGSKKSATVMRKSTMDRPAEPLTSPKSKAAAEVLRPVRPKEEEIRKRAYEIFLSRQGAPGDPVGDWLQAERELLERMTAQRAAR